MVGRFFRRQRAAYRAVSQRVQFEIEPALVLYFDITTLNPDMMCWKYLYFTSYKVVSDLTLWKSCPLSLLAVCFVKKALKLNVPDVVIIDILKQYRCSQWTSFVFSMVKERLGLPKDQTIVFNVHRFPFLGPLAIGNLDVYCSQGRQVQVSSRPQKYQQTDSVIIRLRSKVFSIIRPLC